MTEKRTLSGAPAANAVARYDPSRENAKPERPQTLRLCSIKNILSAIYAQSNAARILNRPTPRGSAFPQTHDRPAQGSKLHRAVMRKKEDRSLLCRKHRRVAKDKREYLKREYQFFRRRLPTLEWACRCGTAAGTPPCTWQAGQSAAGRRRGRRRTSSTRSR